MASHTAPQTTAPFQKPAPSQTSPASPGAGASAAASFRGGLASLDDEHNYLIDDIEGEVPAGLRGTFYRNGPGRLEVGGQKYGHWFDGDGMVCSFTFDDDGVRFRNRYVRTKKYLGETAAGAVRYRSFGTQIPGCLLYTSPSPRDATLSRMPSSA